MTLLRTRTNRRRSQRGVVVRGLLVVMTLVAGVGLQLAGPRLQNGLASWLGVAGIAPRASACASMPSSGLSTGLSTGLPTPPSASAMHSRKVAAAVTTAPAPAI